MSGQDARFSEHGTRSVDQGPRSTDYVLVDGVVVPRADVIREHMEEAASYEGPAQSGLVAHGTGPGSPLSDRTGRGSPAVQRPTNEKLLG